MSLVLFFVICFLLFIFAYVHGRNNNIVLEKYDVANELPWDVEVGYCDVLRNREQDLFSNVRDVNTIVFY